MEFGINLVHTRRTIYAIYCKFMKTGSVVVAQEQEDQEVDVRGKHSSLTADVFYGRHDVIFTLIFVSVVQHSLLGHKLSLKVRLRFFNKKSNLQ